MKNLKSGYAIMLDTNALQWTRQPLDFTITDSRIEIITAPHTDLWQRTYYHFRNDNAPVLQILFKTFLSFLVGAMYTMAPVPLLYDVRRLMSHDIILHKVLVKSSGHTGFLFF